MKEYQMVGRDVVFHNGGHGRVVGIALSHLTGRPLALNVECPDGSVQALLIRGKAWRFV